VADELSVDTDAIRDNSWRLDSVGDTVDRARDKLQRRLDQLGQCWGRDDEVAQAYARQYVPGRDEVLDGSGKVSALLHDLGARSRQASQGYADAETVNTQDAAPR
jgi:uncharacterized protein YukE